MTLSGCTRRRKRSAGSAGASPAGFAFAGAVWRRPNTWTRASLDGKVSLFISRRGSYPGKKDAVNGRTSISSNPAFSATSSIFQLCSFARISRVEPPCDLASTRRTRPPGASTPATEAKNAAMSVVASLALVVFQLLGKTTGYGKFQDTISNSHRDFGCVKGFSRDASIPCSTLAPSLPSASEFDAAPVYLEMAASRVSSDVTVKCALRPRASPVSAKTRSRHLPKAEFSSQTPEKSPVRRGSPAT